MPKAELIALAVRCYDEQRLQALRRYNVLDTPAEQDFDDIVRLVADICGVSIAVINFIDADRQFFKAEVGLGMRQTPLAPSICAHAFAEEDLYIVPDTLLDEEFAHDPLVTGAPYLRFYAGAALRTDDGHALGTLSVLDTVPRELTGVQKHALRTLARQVMNQLELRRVLAAANVTEAALRLANAQADAASKAKDLFLSFLSHELRTPLTPALLTATAIATDERQSPENRADAAMIQRNIELATRLTDDLLDVTRIAHGKLELHVEATDAHAILKNGLAMCQADAGAKNVRLVLDAIAREHTVDAEPSKLTQVITNLLRNAIKFTPGQGTVTVRSTNADNRRFVVEVSDTGVGVAAELLPRIFNLYEQGGAAVTRETGGLGLGLAICKGIVEAHGGTITAASAGKGRGTTIRVELPLSSAAIVSPPVVAVPEKRATAPALDILLVDDHLDTLAAMSRLLKRQRHRVTTASCVSEALDVAATHTFDVLISDVGLPDGTGLDLMRELLKRRPIKGIALTGYGSESDVEQTRAAGFLAHLVKPINFTQLEALLLNVGS